MQKLSISIILFFLLSTSVIAQSTKWGLAPVIWLRGDQDTTILTQWTDVSGNKKNATSLSEEGPLKKGVLNFNKALVFDGVNDYMKIPYSLEGLTGITLFTVFHSSDSTERGIWGTEKGLSRNSMLTTRKVAGPDSIVDNYGQHESIAVINTIVQNWTETTTIGKDAYLALGNSGKEHQISPFKGKMAEFIVFDRILGGLERVQIETYLAIKYGIPLKGNYVNSDEIVLWNAKNNKEFSNRITGIGRDDAFYLYQKQSKSSLDPSGLLTISAKSLASSNDENKTTMQDADFLLWGDNGRALRDIPGQEGAVISFIDRKWLMNVNGSANLLPTEMRLDLKKLPANPLGYWLVIDRSGRDDFSIDKLDYILPDSITTDSIAIYKNVHWDKDISGSDVFGFAKAQSLFVVLNPIKDPTCQNQEGGSINIKVLTGKAPYTYELINKTQNIFRKGDGSESIEVKELSAGEYVLKIKDADKGEVERVFVLKLPEALLVDLGEDLDLRQITDKKIVLDASIHIPDSIPVSYSWTSSHGFKSSKGKIKISESGIYKVTVTTEAGCVFTDEIIVSGAIAQKFDVFPAPVHAGDQYNVGVSLDKSADVIIRICDTKGTVREEIRDKNRSEYHFVHSLQTPGMYLIVLQTAKGIETRKIIVH